MFSKLFNFMSTKTKKTGKRRKTKGKSRRRTSKNKRGG